MKSFSRPVQKLLSSYWIELPRDRYGKDEPKIKVNVSISRLAFVYEKIRNAIDYKDEHLLRKNAMQRMLKRRFYTEDKKINLGRLLLTELIRARYLPNNEIPERIIVEVDAILEKYLTLLMAVAPNRLTKERRQAADWIMSVCATDIEHHLVPPVREDALVECMYKAIRPDIDLALDIIDARERDMQVYLAIHKSLIRSDAAILRYHLLHFFLPQWKRTTPAITEHFARKFWDYYRQIEYHVTHPFGDRLFRFVKRFTILFNILRDMIAENPEAFEDISRDPSLLEEKIRETCNFRYKQAHARLRRSYIRTIIYIFITKMMLALAVEFPYDVFIIKSTNYVPLAINVIFHPILMLFIASSIRVPSQRNTDKIVELVTRIVFEEPHQEFLYKKKKVFTRSRVTEALFNIVYFITYLVTFGLLVWLLRKFDFNIVSGFLFLFFLTVVSFFGMRLRNEVKELVVIDQKDSFIAILIDFFSLPILRVGQWVSAKTPKINLFLFVLDFIIEAPFKIFIEVSEEWTGYQKEKKEEIY